MARAVGLRFLPRWRFTLLLSIRYNPQDSLRPGGLVEHLKFVDVEDRLLGRFGGFTKVTSPRTPVVEGQWRDPTTGLIYSDQHRRYEIVCGRDHAHSSFFLELYRELLALFRQEEIFLARDATYLAAGRVQPPADEHAGD